MERDCGFQKKRLANGRNQAEKETNEPDAKAILSESHCVKKQFSFSNPEPVKNRFPSIAITTDKVLPGVTTAVQFSQEMRKRLIQNDSKTEVSEPKEEVINGKGASYMEISGKGTHDVPFRFGWYQFLVQDLIITLQYSDSEYQYREGFADFHKIVESMEIKDNEVK